VRTGPDGRAPTQLTFVTAPGCGHCDHGRQVLAEVSERIPLIVREVDLGSAEGRALLATHRFAFPPAVIAGEQLLGHGRLSAKRLARRLAGESG
jgi:thiol-disulfide isomerase/thioredoxin